MEEAIYIALLAKGCRDLFSGAVDDNGRPLTAYDYIRDVLPLAQGNALIHAIRILDGQVMIWPALHLSRLGRWWQRVRAFFRRRRDERRIDTTSTE